jgi:dethiobiotin synthetase
MLSRLSLPSLFITATDTEVGKTVIAGAIADWFRARGANVGVLKPVATGCVHRREGLVSEDAEFLAHCAQTRFPLDVICPNRYAEGLSPNVAAERRGVPMDWHAVQRSIDTMSQTCVVLIVEGVGGVMAPVDASHTVLNLAQWIGSPAVVVARPGLGTINHTVLTVDALRTGGVKVAGVVVNRYPADGASVAQETNPRQIERWGKTQVLAVVPEAPVASMLPEDIIAAVAPVDWEALARAAVR